ncbi:MAG TPA: hypothetical protein VFR86_30925, partial [Burkholderiaceae bacterium]|nr:hypothetical protein [Burkholderiaceae bacterium]
MKRNTIATVLLAAGLAALPMYSIAQAQAQKPAPTAPRMGAGPDTAAMAEQMKKMQAQMDKIRQTTDPKEREQLLA